MSALSAKDLARKKCVPCEGGVPPLTTRQVEDLLNSVPGWGIAEDGKHLRREWKLKDFAQALAFANEVGAIAEDEGHHPDLHLVGWNRVKIEITTHAIGGLSENDFILAAKINAIAPAVR